MPKNYRNYSARQYETKEGLTMCWGGVESEARSTNYLGVSEEGGKSELLLA